MIGIVLTVLGLSLFEIISSIDNAIINAEVLAGMEKKYRQFFLRWGMLFAVVVVRGLLPFLILWIVGPTHSLVDASHLLLIGGGTFLMFLFFHWLFLEQKNYGFVGERFFHSQGVWFYAVASILLAGIVWSAIRIDPLLGFSAVIGSTAFFIIHGFKQQAQDAEKSLQNGKMSNMSKILYLEVIDTAFSIDGVLGSFAFTLSLPLIILGNGLGAIVLRKLTVSNISRIQRYIYLENGAMYSVLVLGVVMVSNAFGADIPEWISPIATISIVGFFTLKSYKKI